MKRNKIILCTILLSLAIIICVTNSIYSDFNGTEISKLIKNELSNTICIEKSNLSIDKPNTDYKNLSSEQKGRLISLIEGTKFKRINSKYVPFTDKERYLITITTHDNKILFRMESYGRDFVIVDSIPGDTPAKHWKLRIKNNKWKSCLEDIIAISN